MARPVLEGLCKYESLKDGTLTLSDIAEMNDWIMWDNDNRALAREP